MTHAKMLMGRRRGPVANIGGGGGGAVVLNAKAATASQAKATLGTAGWGASLPTLHVDNVGRTYYVDGASGNDSNNGTSTGTAWATLAGAVSNLAGTVTAWPTNQDVIVYIRNVSGTQVYQAASTARFTMQPTFNGSTRQPNANRWLIWSRYPGDARPIIKPPDGTNLDKVAIFTVNSGSFVGGYQKFVGLEIDGDDTRRGAGASGTNGDVIGIYISGTSSARIEIVDCEIHGLQANGNSAGVGKAQGIFVDPSNPDSLYAFRNKIYDIGTTTQTIDIQEHAIYSGSIGAIVVNNVIYNCINGFGIQMYRNNSTAMDNCIITHNTVDGTIEKSGIVIPGFSSNCRIKNNIVRDCGQYGIEFYPATFTGSGNQLDHNIMYNNPSGARSHASPSGWTIASELTSNPLHTNDGTRDYTLQAGSPAIDAADSAFSPNIDFVATGRSSPDIGAYERP